MFSKGLFVVLCAIPFWCRSKDAETCTDTVEVKLFDHSAQNRQNENVSHANDVSITASGEPGYRKIQLPTAPGVYKVLVTYEIKNVSGGEPEDHKAILRIYKLACHTSEATLIEMNNTHSFVVCGVKTSLADSKIIWKEESKGELSELRDKHLFYFKMSTRGKFSCTQTLLEPVFSRMTEVFTLSPPKRPENVELTCNPPRKSYPSNDLGCGEPMIYLKHQTDADTYRVKYQVKNEELRTLEDKKGVVDEGGGVSIKIQPDHSGFQLPALISVSAVNKEGIASEPAVIAVYKNPRTPWRE